MSIYIVKDPSESDLAQLQATDSANPFASALYASARRALGATVVLFAESDEGTITRGAIGYLRGRSISPRLEIPSAPDPERAIEFWHHAREFCRKARVVQVDVNSYGAKAVRLPLWSAPSRVRERTEWLVDLKTADVSHYASNHRRNIAKARKHGVTVTSTTDPATAVAHRRLMAASMTRHSDRGKDVPSISEQDTCDERAMLVSGVARIHQAMHDGDIISSVLVLNSPEGAYYHSAGTTARGMEMGASTFLVSEVIRTLANEGSSVFNIGGAGPESEGLMRFKQGFGARAVRLAAGTYDTGTPFQRGLRSGVQLLRQPFEFRRSLSQLLARS